MFQYTARNKRNQGFTIVELAIVVSVLVILAGLTVFGFGKWRENTAETELSSELSIAATATKNEINFKGSVSGLPASYKPGSGVNITYTPSTGAGFCIEGSSKSVPYVKMFINETGKISKGTCASGEAANYSDIP